jgi:hypothetical protein
MRAITLAVCAAVLLGQVGSAFAEDLHPSVSGAASRLGVSPYQSNTWGIVNVGMMNPTNRDVRILVSTSVGNVKTNQYGREFWVPANSRRISWHSIFIPEDKSGSANSVAVDSIVSERVGGRERVLKTSTGAIAHDGVLSYSGINSPTTVIVDMPEPKDGFQVPLDGETVTALNAVGACQFSIQRRRATLEMSQTFLPPVTTAWDGTKHIVLVGDSLADDSAAMTAVRRWLMDGGRMWIMLDLVQQDTVERLLGDGCPYREVDRVGLTTLQVKASKGSSRPSDPKQTDHEQPIPFVRTLVTGVEVTHTINEWPAAFEQVYGRGKIIFTTLGMRAWLRPTGIQDGSYSDAGIQQVPNETLRDLMNYFYGFQQPAMLEPELFDEYLSQQIGYEVVDFNIVLLVLTISCGGLLVAGMWLVRTHRFRLLVWAGPAFAITASGVLMVVGMRNLHSVPNTVATIQLVAVAPESDDLNLTGLLSVYRQDESQKRISVVNGGTISPTRASQSGTTRRMVWTDIDSWHWENSAIPAGVNRSTIRFSRNIRKPVRAVGSFGPDGLSGRLDSQPFEQPGDAVLVTTALHPLSVKFQDDGSFVAGSNELMTGGEYIGGVLLSDEQRRRQDLYRKLLTNKRRSTLIDKPTMFVWTKSIETGYAISSDETFRGSALLSIPLQLERTPPGRQVTIPGTFLPYRGVSGPKGLESSGHLSNADGTWLERSRPARTWLRAEIPPEVLPLRMTRLTITLRLSGKSQPVKIVELVDGKPRVLATRTSPEGVQRIEIKQTETLQIDESGGVTIGIFVGDTLSLNEYNMTETQGERWNIDFLYLEIAGTTLEVNP